MINYFEQKTPAREYLIRQTAMHPAMRPRDLIKLCYQAVFGVEHLLEDFPAAQRSFDEEFASVTANASPLYEQISPDRCRVNLAGWKERGLRPEWLFRMFISSAAMPSGTTEEFEHLLEEVNQLCAFGSLPFSRQDWEEYRKDYERSGGGAVHHSSPYVKTESPSYRVICSRFIRLFPLLEKLENLTDQQKVYVIALDGRAASGKTTMAEQLSLILKAGVVHMDDFFIPAALRTETRLNEPGGNVHYERFMQEVLPKVARFEPFSYRRFDCSKLDFGDSKEVCASRWRVVEGAYSCHPLFGSYADIKGFCDVEREEQLRRISLRNGEKQVKVFAERWIPMEEQYFKEFAILDEMDLVL